MSTPTSQLDAAKAEQYLIVSRANFARELQRTESEVQAFVDNANNRIVLLKQQIAQIDSMFCLPQDVAANVAT